MKTRYTVSGLLLFSISLCAQTPPTIEWEKIIGGDDWDVLSSVERTSDGGYILGGDSGSGISGDKTEEGLPEDYWVIKTDDAGNIIWQNSIGGDVGEGLTTALPLADGGYILAGGSGSGISGDKTEACRGESDFWIVKINSTGDVIWDKTFGGVSFDFLTCFTRTTDGGYLAGGTSSSPASGDKTEDNSGGSSDYGDYWMVKLDSDANIIWQNTIGGNRYDFMTCVIQTADGGYMAGGYSQSDSSGDKTENNAGDDLGLTPDIDYWLLKLNADGSIAWQNTIGGDNVDYLTAIQQTADGGYIIGGSSSSNTGGDKTLDSRGDSDFWILKLDSAGNILWQNTFGGSDQDQLSAIKQTPDGGFIVGGNSYSNASGDKTEDNFEAGGRDLWIVKLNISGFLEWQKTIGDLGSDKCSAIQFTDDGGYLVAGSNSFYDDGYIPDYWLVKLAFIPDAVVDAINRFSVSVYPNPSSGNFTADVHAAIQNNDILHISLVNMAGEVMYFTERNFEYGKSIETIQLENKIAAGIYTLKIISGNHSFNKTIVIN